MKKTHRIISAIISCIIACLTVTMPLISADDNIYFDYTTSAGESQESGLEPFDVFEIYNAFFGITTTAPATVVTTATTTTTAVTTAVTTKPVTTAPVTKAVTTKPVTTVPVTKAVTTKPVTASPVTTAVTTKPVTTVPVTTAVTKKPVTTAPVTTAVTTKPVTTAPVTTAVTTKPVTTVPVTKAVTTKPVTTAPPITTTIAPTTIVTVVQQGQLPPGNYKRGIDVSEHQGLIDWKAVKDSGLVDFAIIRAGYGKFADQIDDNFIYNIENAQANGIDVGIYWFSYAADVDEAKLEAEVCYEIIKSYKFSYPVYFDFEYEKTLNSNTPAVLSAMVDAFCTTLQEKGYYTGVYSYASCLESKIYRHVLEKYDVWVAQYKDVLDAYSGHYGMWQYTKEATVPGISGNLDMSYCYRDYPAVVGENPASSARPVTSLQTSASVVTVTTKTVPTTAAPVQSQTTKTTSRTTTASPSQPAVTTTTEAQMFTYGGYLIRSDTEVIDWSEYDESSYSFAMIAVDRNSDMDILAQNIDAAHAADIDCGITFAVTDGGPLEAAADAAALYEVLRYRQLEYPLYYFFDKTDFSQYSADSEQLNAAADAFCAYFQARKFYIGIAAYDVVLKNSIDPFLLNLYDAWLWNEPQSPYEYTGVYNMVSQYSVDQGGYIISSRRFYPTVMTSNHLNGY